MRVSRLLLHGGAVYGPTPDATALLIDGDQVSWVGSSSAAAALRDAADTVVDLQGRWVAPAFVDAHVHVVAAGMALAGLDLSGASSLAEVLAGVERAAREAPSGGLVWGTGWDETAFRGGERRPPTPAELDAAAGGRPVYLTRVDMHSAAVSPAVLRGARLERTVGDEPLRGEDHHAARRVARRLLTGAQTEVVAATFLRRAAALGIGMVHECSGPEIGDAAELRLVREAAAESGVELTAYWGEPGAAGVARAAAWDAAPAGDVFVDGSIGSRTAALSAPYADGDGCGQLLLDVAAVADHLIEATRAGMQAGFHALGDRAVTAVADGLHRAAAVVGPGALAAARHRVEHVEMCGIDERDAFARYGVVACMQPAFDARWGGAEGMYARRVGGARSGAMNDFAGLAAAGVPLAFGSDAPVTPLDPWGAVRAAMIPWRPGHALSARAAFTAHTRGGYRAARRDGEGVLRPGAPATFAVWEGVGALQVSAPDARVAAWSTDPRSGTAGLPDLSAVPPTCVATVVQGAAVHDSGLLEGWTRNGRQS